MTVNNNISPQYWTSRLKTEQAQQVEFAPPPPPQIIKQPEGTNKANADSAIPQELAQKIDALSYAMSNNMGAVDIIWYRSSQNATDGEEDNYNVSYILGDYEYSISKADKELNYSAKDVTSGEIDIKKMLGFWGENQGYDGASFHLSANNTSDKSRYTTSQYDERENARFRPFAYSLATSRANPYAYNGENATFPKELDKQENQDYAYSDMQNSLDKIESLLDKYLVAAYQENPDSTETNQLLFLKAQLQSLPETLQKGKQAAIEKFNELISGVRDENDLRFVMLQLQSFEHFAQYETGMLAEFSMNLAALLPEDQKQELMNALNVVLNYTDYKAYELLDTDKQLLESTTKMRNALGDYSQSLVSRFSAIDNTEILLNLAADSSNLQTNVKESKSYESLIDRIRSKLKGTDDSILQQVMSKITNGVKTAGTSGIGEGA